MARFTRILSIDGGGVRGIIAGQVLISLEQKLRDQTNNAHVRIADYFDMIAGTSTGGILTCIYLAPGISDPTRPRWPAEKAVDFYLAEAGKIFHVSPWQWLRSLGGLCDEKYSAIALENACERYFGNLRLSQLLKPCLITAYDIEARGAKFFTQHDASSNSKDYLVRDVVRATSAAPAYFEVARIDSLAEVPYPLIDGGVFANNPTMCAYAEVRNKFPANPTASDMAILSIGNGLDDHPYEYAKAKDWGIISWLRPLFEIILSGSSETVDYQMRQIFDAVGRPTQYLRVDGKILNASLAFDRASAENLELLKQEGIRISRDFNAQLDNFVTLLLAQ